MDYQEVLSPIPTLDTLSRIEQSLYESKEKENSGLSRKSSERKTLISNTSSSVDPLSFSNTSSLFSETPAHGGASTSTNVFLSPALSTVSCFSDDSVSTNDTSTTRITRRMQTKIAIRDKSPHRFHVVPLRQVPKDLAPPSDMKLRRLSSRHKRHLDSPTQESKEYLAERANRLSAYLESLADISTTRPYDFDAETPELGSQDHAELIVQPPADSPALYLSSYNEPERTLVEDCRPVSPVLAYLRGTPSPSQDQLLSRSDCKRDTSFASASSGLSISKIGSKMQDLSSLSSEETKKITRSFTMVRHLGPARTPSQRRKPTRTLSDTSTITAVTLSTDSSSDSLNKKHTRAVSLLGGPESATKRLAIYGDEQRYGFNRILKDLEDDEVDEDLSWRTDSNTAGSGSRLGLGILSDNELCGFHADLDSDSLALPQGNADESQGDLELDLERTLVNINTPISPYLPPKKEALHISLSQASSTSKTSKVKMSIPVIRAKYLTPPSNRAGRHPIVVELMDLLDGAIKEWRNLGSELRGNEF